MRFTTRTLSVLALALAFTGILVLCSAVLATSFTDNRDVAATLLGIGALLVASGGMVLDRIIARSELPPPVIKI